jgi:hypothetical protein
VSERELYDKTVPTPHTVFKSHIMKHLVETLTDVGKDMFSILFDKEEMRLLRFLITWSPMRGCSGTSFSNLSFVNHR